MNELTLRPHLVQDSVGLHEHLVRGKLAAAVILAILALGLRIKRLGLPPGGLVDLDGFAVLYARTRNENGMQQATWHSPGGGGGTGRRRDGNTRNRETQDEKTAHIEQGVEVRWRECIEGTTRATMHTRRTRESTKTRPPPPISLSTVPHRYSKCSHPKTHQLPHQARAPCRWGVSCRPLLPCCLCPPRLLISCHLAHRAGPFGYPYRKYSISSRWRLGVRYGMIWYGVGYMWQACAAVSWKVTQNHKRPCR